MKISVVTPNYNGERFLEETIRSVISQRGDGVDLEYIVVDAKSKDRSPEIIRAYSKDISRVISEKDTGPANAINKGLRVATGDILCWLNADDLFMPGALKRVAEVMGAHSNRALCFGHCPIVNESGTEIRAGITRFKEFFYPLSSRFTIQCINYISQPAMFFRRTAFEKAGPLREDWTAAWDYDLILRLWRQGGAVRIEEPAVSAFRWHQASISGQHFRRQFKEEWDAVVADAGWCSLQTLVHLGVRWGIVGSYTLMAARRSRGR